MDSSNVAHFGFSLLVPIALTAILLPFAQIFFRSAPSFLLAILSLSFAVICGKELIDAEASINDLVADTLGFVIGVALVSSQLRRTRKVLRHARDREVFSQTISLRSTLALIEKIERRSATFYQTAASQLPNPRASGTCLLLAQDAKKRAQRILFTLTEWKFQLAPEDLSTAIERAFASDQIFSLDFSATSSPREVLELAIEHEKKKLSLFSKFETAFQSEWKAMRLGAVLAQLSKQIKKLELCLAEQEKQTKSAV